MTSQEKRNLVTDALEYEVSVGMEKCKKWYTHLPSQWHEFSKKRTTL